MGDSESTHLIQVDVTGADEASAQLDTVAEAETSIADAHEEMGGTFAKGLEMTGFRMLSHELSTSLGIGRQGVILFHSLHPAIEEADVAAKGLVGTLGPWILGITLVGTAIVELISHLKHHKEAVEDVNTEVKKFLDQTDQARIAYDDVTKGILDYAEKLEATIKAEKDQVQVQQESIDRYKKLKEEGYAVPELAEEYNRIRTLNGEIDKNNALLETTRKMLKQRTEEHKSSHSEEMKTEKEHLEYTKALEREAVENNANTEDEKKEAVRIAADEEERIIDEQLRRGLISKTKHDTDLINLTLDTARKMEQIEKDAAKNRIDYQGQVQLFMEDSFRTIAVTAGKSAAGTEGAWTAAEKSLIEGFAGLIEKELDMWAVSQVAMGNLVGAAAAFAAEGVVAAGATALEGSLSTPTASGSTVAGGSDKNPGETPRTSPSSPTVGGGGGGGGGQQGSGTVNATVVINAGIMYLPDRSSLEQAVKSFWLESGVMMNAGQIPKVNFA